MEESATKRKEISQVSFTTEVRTAEGFIVPDVGTYVKVSRRVIKLKMSHDKTFETESFNGIVVGVYPYQIAVHRIDENGIPLRGIGSIVYFRAQEVHMRKLRKHHRQILDSLEELAQDEIKENSVNITMEDIIAYCKLIPHRSFSGYEVGEYVAVEERSIDERKSKRYILRIEDKRDTIMIGMEYRYGRPYMLRYILAVQLEKGQVKMKKVPEKVAFLPHTYEELALEVI